MAFLSRSLIIFSAPDESNRNSSPAYFLLDLPRELRHIHRLAGGRHPINHEKLAPYLLLLASSLKSMSRLLDRWATQGWAYLFLAWPAIIIEKIQIRAKASYAFSTTKSREPQGSIHQNDALKTEIRDSMLRGSRSPNRIFRSQKYIRQAFNQRKIFCFTCFLGMTSSCKSLENVEMLCNCKNRALLKRD